MIVCFNLNPCIDENIDGQKTVSCFAGKGLNAGRFLRSMGHEVFVCGFMPREDSSRFQRHLQSLGIGFSFCETDGKVRKNVKIIDGGELVERNEDALEITKKQAEKMLEIASEICQKATHVLLCGSLPKGAPDDFYAQIIRIIPPNVFVALDTSKQYLKEGLKAGVSIVKPNKAEAEHLLGIEICNLESAKEAAKSIYDTYNSHVLLSLGAKGGMYYDGQNCHYSRYDIPCKNPVGAGDCMLSGAIDAFVEKMQGKEILQRAIAAATAKITSDSADKFHLKFYRKLINEIEVTLF